MGDHDRRRRSLSNAERCHAGDLRPRLGGIRGHAEAGDHFGSVVYLAGLEEELTLAVGIPDEDIGRAKDAGAVAL